MGHCCSSLLLEKKEALPRFWGVFPLNISTNYLQGYLLLRSKKKITARISEMSFHLFLT